MSSLDHKRRSTWSMLHWFQKAIVVMGFTGLVMLEAGAVILSGSSLGWSVVELGAGVGLTSLLFGYFAEGLGQDRRLLEE